MMNKDNKQEKKWVTPKLEVLSHKDTLGGVGPDIEDNYGYYASV